MVDEDGYRGVGADIAQALEVGGPFGFRVDREVKRVSVQRVTDRHDVRPAVGAGRREASDSRGLDARMHFNRVHDRESGACIGNLRLSHTDETARRINGQMAWMVFAFGAP